MKKLMGTLLLNGALLAGSQGAVIDWTTNAITGYASDIVTDGTLIEAVNGVGGSVTNSPTINGVTFTADGTLLGGSWTGDPWTVTNVFDAGYDELLSTIDFESSGTGPVTVKTFQGLTDGAEYVIQYWYADSGWQNPDPDRTLTLDGTGVNVINGISYAVGTFTADASTQDLIVTASHNGPRLTAYQLRAISGHVEPDPIIALSVTNLVFDSTFVGYTNSLTLTVKNVGGEILDGTASVDSPFSIESGSTYSLSNNQSQVVTVLFAPQTDGEVTESLVFTGGGGTTISVSGTGVTEPEPSLGLSVSNLAFSSTYVGYTNSLTVTVKNEGGKTLAGTAAVAAPFAIASGADYSLGLGEEQDVVILFAPVAEGDFLETLSFSGADGTNISVAGTAEILTGLLVADIAGDYTGPSAEPEGWDYIYSDAAVGGVEVALTPDRAVASSYGSGNTGFGMPTGQYGVPAVLGSLTGSDQYEIFSDGYDGKNSDLSWGNYGVPGTDLLMHPGGDTNNAFVIVRYTFSEDDLADSSTVSIIGSFRDEVGKTSGDPGGSITAEIYLNASSLFSTTGSVGRLSQSNGTFNVTDLTVAVGDTISFVVGNNGLLNGDETALTGKILAQVGSAPVILPGAVLNGDTMEFEFSGAPGSHYVVQSSDQLTSSGWETVEDVNPLISSPVAVSVSATNQTEFFRIMFVE
jgi:hypothetical protein